MPRKIADGQLEADDHHDFVGGDDLHELRIALDLDDLELQLQDVLPGVAEFVEEQPGDPRHQAQLDFGQRTAGQGTALAAAAQQAVDDRIEDRGVDVEDQVAFQRLGLQEVEAGGVLQAEDELAVGELIDAGELDLDDAPQQGRQGGAEVAAEAFVQRLQGPHLLLADPLGTLEIVGRDLFAVLARPRRIADRPSAAVAALRRRWPPSRSTGFPLPPG